MLCVCTKSLFMYVASYGYSKVLLCRRSTWPAVARGPWCGAFAGSRGDTSTISWQRWRVWIQYDEINGWFLFYMDHHGLWIISIILFHDIISIWSSKWFHYHNIPYYGYGLNPYGYNYCGHLRQVELASTITDKQWVRHHPDPLGGISFEPGQISLTCRIQWIQWQHMAESMYFWDWGCWQCAGSIQLWSYAILYNYIQLCAIMDEVVDELCSQHASPFRGGLDKPL